MGSNNIPVHLKITVPQDAQPEQRWDIGISFTTVAPNTGGVGLAGAVVKGFPVKVIEEVKPAPVSKVQVSQNLVAFIVLVAILIILIFIMKYFYKRKKE